MENRLSVRNVDFTVKQRRHNGIRISGQTPVHLLKYSDRKLLKTGSKASCADCHVSLVDCLPLCSPSSRAGSRRRYPSLVGESAPASSPPTPPVPPTSM